jgi:hypothetical protein
VLPDAQLQAGLAIGRDGALYLSTPGGQLHAYGTVMSRGPIIGR